MCTSYRTSLSVLCTSYRMTLNDLWDRGGRVSSARCSPHRQRGMPFPVPAMVHVPCATWLEQLLSSCNGDFYVLHCVFLLCLAASLVDFLGGYVTASTVEGIYSSHAGASFPLPPRTMLGRQARVQQNTYFQLCMRGYGGKGHHLWEE